MAKLILLSSRAYQPKIKKRERKVGVSGILVVNLDRCYYDVYKYFRNDWESLTDQTQLGQEDLHVTRIE